MMKKLWKCTALVLALALGSCMFCGCSDEETTEVSSIAADSENEAAETIDEETVTEEVLADETAEADGELTDDESEEDAWETASYEAEEETEAVTTAYEETVSDDLYLDPDGTYDSRDEVALYLYLYGELPSNYMTKKEAQNLGWSGGSLEQYAEGMCIGGSSFGNYEGILPDATYHECDIDTLGASSRGAKRIVYSTDGDIYYTEDHYETFLLLYTADGPAEDEVIFGN